MRAKSVVFFCGVLVGARVRACVHAPPPIIMRVHGSRLLLCGEAALLNC